LERKVELKISSRLEQKVLDWSGHVKMD
jgi:hypothetical protein